MPHPSRPFDVTSGRQGVILVAWTGTRSSACFAPLRRRAWSTSSSARRPWASTGSSARPRTWISSSGPPSKTSSDDLYFDILTRLGEAASFETVEAEIKEVEGTRVNVATPAALYRLKKGTIRSEDHQDAAALRERFNLKEED
jgi:hypothetical protein